MPALMDPHAQPLNARGSPLRRASRRSALARARAVLQHAAPAKGVSPPKGLQVDDVTPVFVKHLLANDALRATNSGTLESDLKSKENLFEAADWEMHSSVGRFWRHVAAMPTSRTVQKVLIPSTFCFAETLLIGAYSTLRPHGWGDVPPVGPEFFNLTSSALALLLVFRTDASYYRWDDARRVWGELIFTSRNLLRGFFVALPTPAHAPLRVALATWTVAFSATLKLHVRGDASAAAMRAELGPWLTEGPLDALTTVRHRPNHVLSILSHLVRRAPPAEVSSLDANLAAFEEVLGRCERIQRVPIPLSYTRHTSRFLIAWLLILPLHLWTALGWDALLFGPLATFLLFGVDQIGVDLEQPFAVLPLDLLADRIKIDAVDLLTLSDEAVNIVASVELDGTCPAFTACAESMPQRGG